MPLVQSSCVETLDGQVLSHTLFPLHRSCLVAAERRVISNQFKCRVLCFNLGQFLGSCLSPKAGRRAPTRFREIMPDACWRENQFCTSQERGAPFRAKYYNYPLTIRTAGAETAVGSRSFKVIDTEPIRLILSIPLHARHFLAPGCHTFAGPGPGGSGP